MPKSKSGLRPVQVPLVLGAVTWPQSWPSLKMSYPVTPTLSVEAVQCTVTVVGVMLSWTGVPGGLGGGGAPPPPGGAETSDSSREDPRLAAGPPPLGAETPTDPPAPGPPGPAAAPPLPGP